jgi:tetratricopeptide (TPR) repeat protein
MFRLRKIWQSALMIVLVAPTVAAQLPKPGELAESANAVRFEALYDQGRQLYEGGRYVEAAPIFAKLFRSSDLRGRKAAVAYALGQCRRLFGDFPGALHAYERALAEYSGQTGDEAIAWQSASVDQLSIVSTNLAVVDLIRPEGTGADTRLCSLRVDGQPSIRHAEAQLRSWLEAAPHNGANMPHVKAVVAGLLDGGLFGASLEDRASLAPNADRCYGQNIRIVLDRTEDHLIEYSWQRAGQPLRGARFQLRKTDIGSGEHVVHLQHLAAVLSLRYTESDGKEIPMDRVRRVSAFLTPRGPGSEVPIERGRPQEIVAGSYKLIVNAAGWLEDDPISLTLHPGEVRTVDVPLEKPSFYQLPWFPWVVAGVAVAGTAVFVSYAMLSPDGGNDTHPEPLFSVPIP